MISGLYTQILVFVVWLINDVNPSTHRRCEARKTVRAARRSGEVLQVVWQPGRWPWTKQINAV